jgi:hypothetical protein
MSAHTLTCTHKLWYPSQALDQLSARDGQQPVMHQQAADIFQKLATELDTEGRYLFLNALANQLRFPNNHTHYFSCILLYLFDQNAKVSYCSHDGLSEDISVTAWGALSCLQLCWQPTCLNFERVSRDSGASNLMKRPQLAFSRLVSLAQRRVCLSLPLKAVSTGCTELEGCCDESQLI